MGNENLMRADAFKHFTWAAGSSPLVYSNNVFRLYHTATGFCTVVGIETEKDGFHSPTEAFVHVTISVAVTPYDLVYQA